MQARGRAHHLARRPARLKNPPDAFTKHKSQREDDAGAFVGRFTPDRDEEHMQLPTTTEALPRLSARLEFHLAYLEASAAFDELVEPTRAWLRRADDLELRRKQIARLLIQRRAVRELADETADEALRAFEIQLLALARRVREDRRYQVAFGRAPLSALIRLAPADEARALQELLTALAALAQEPDQADLADFLTREAPPLQEAADALAQAEAALQEALAQRVTFQRDLELFRMDLRRLLQKNYADIQQRYPHQKTRVERFFTNFRRSGGSAPITEDDLEDNDPEDDLP
jgi:hypothetical protein